MANKKFVQIVEITCKTIWKTPCKSPAKFRAKLLVHPKSVYKIFIPPTFPTLPTKLFTTPPPLSLSNLFHYSTTPTNTTINKIIERN